MRLCQLSGHSLIQETTIAAAARANRIDPVEEGTARAIGPASRIVQAFASLIFRTQQSRSLTTPIQKVKEFKRLWLMTRLSHSRN